MLGRDGGGHPRIDLVGDHLPAGLGQGGGELPAAGADLVHEVVGAQVRRVDEPAHGGRIGDEVLTERPARAGVRVPG